ncbi:M18 family aminopeptidase [Mobilicoccus caccae]|uniref:M18 family aminopeptidase n=1 Tax=Mobilicoccus caccae TaxID=1859295 RepID=A0ABQ6ITM0_9MICO|nr:M18 family aminopeptidase [Mobilicoccus caccae]GMA41260.1 putative M18 family aminopeptidase 2 [Mobilicoccus caccae]
MAADIDAHARDLCTFIDASPSPYHAVAEVTRRLVAAGFNPIEERDAWPGEPGRYVVRRGGSVAAWSTEHAVADPATPFRVVGGHTDSPNLRISPLPDRASHGWDQLVVEVYGGPLLNSWLDRDLGISGRVAVRDTDSPGGVAERLVRVDEAVLRVPQLAIHLDRDANSGLALNPQTHLTPIWGATGAAPSFAAYLAGLLGTAERDVLAWDVMTHDLTPSGPLGRESDLLAAPRLDNLGTAFAGTTALLAAVEDADPTHIPLLVLFDHEEIGSTTSSGGDSTFLPSVLERVVATRGGDRQDYHRALADTLVISADMAHATHPNYVEKHEPGHRIAINGGPVLKVNTKGRYASEAPGSAAFALACEQAGVPMQVFRSRGDMPCGSTIGPMSAALTGATTVDVGSPMLSMHSARELTGARDPGMYVAALTATLAPSRH